MRADFARYYNVDIDDVPAGEIWEMVLSMPRGSRVLSLVDPRTEWSDAEYLLADVRDILLAIGYGLAGRKCKVPRTPRPGRKTGEPASSHADMIDRLENTEWEEVSHDSC